MNQSEVLRNNSIPDHYIKDCERKGYRRFFMDYDGSMKAAIFLTPEAFEGKPDIEEEALKALKSIAWSNTLEELSQAMSIIQVLGKSLSTDLFKANPTLAGEVLDIFKGGFTSPSCSVRFATIDITRDIILASRSRTDCKLDSHILESILQGVYCSQKYNEGIVINNAKSVISELNAEFPNESGSVSSLAQAILNSDFKEEIA